MKKNNLFPQIETTIQFLKTDEISNKRKEILKPLINHIKIKVEEGNPIRLNFICTHNSRRSHLSQIWAQTLGHYHGISNLSCYSGGTEATAMFPKVAEILSGHGFEIMKLSQMKILFTL